MSAHTVHVTAERVDAYERAVLPLRLRIIQEMRLEFNETTGSLTGLTQLLQASRDHIESMRAYIETVRDHWIARAAIDQLLAGRLVPVEPGSGDFDPAPTNPTSP